MNILFVCTGNTCRSPMAAYIMDKIAVENELDVLIESAGIFAQPDMPASENAILAMKNKNIDITDHRTQTITEELLEKADVILTMTDGQKMLLEKYCKGKVYTLLEYAGGSGDISDPYGGDIEDYNKAADEIYDAVVDIAEKLPLKKHNDNN